MSWLGESPWDAWVRLVGTQLAVNTLNMGLAAPQQAEHMLSNDPHTAGGIVWQKWESPRAPQMCLRMSAAVQATIALY